jgi:hypothetical protein
VCRFVPLLPRPFLSMVQSPVPYVMGTHVDNYALVSQHLSKLQSAKMLGTFVVNLHHDEVVPPILYSSEVRARRGCRVVSGQCSVVALLTMC